MKLQQKEKSPKPKKPGAVDEYIKWKRLEHMHIK